MGHASAKWEDVSPQSRCPVCGHGDFCTMARDGRTIICRREASWGSRAGKHGVDELGDRWTYSIGGRGGGAGQGGGPGQDVSRESTGAPYPALASEADRGRVYQALIGALPLSSEHRANLRARGLVDAEIDRRGYRTLGRGRARVARTVIDECRCDDALLASVPGFYRQTDPAAGATGPTWWSIAGQSGMLVPVRNVAGQVLAFKIRLDAPDPAGGRYRTLSSTAHRGPGPGGLVHVPLRAGSAEISAAVDVVRITEGEFKADITTALDPSGVLTLSVPGVGAWRAAVEVLRAIGPRVVRLAFDQDGWTNWRVAGAMERAAETLVAEGYELEMETWG